MNPHIDCTHDFLLDATHIYTSLGGYIFLAELYEALLDLLLFRFAFLKTTKKSISSEIVILYIL